MELYDDERKLVKPVSITIEQFRLPPLYINL